MRYGFPALSVALTAPVVGAVVLLNSNEMINEFPAGTAAVVVSTARVVVDDEVADATRPTDPIDCGGGTVVVVVGGTVVVVVGGTVVVVVGGTVVVVVGGTVVVVVGGTVVVGGGAPPLPPYVTMAAIQVPPVVPVTL
jgi:hypothetical protein